MIEPKLLKGFRDISTQDMIKRTYVIEKIRKVVESYGYDQLETPTMEYASILLGNIGEDEKLIYRFTDDGGRDVALRYDQTVGASRYIAMHYNDLPMPFKRYQISNVFRAENTQKGRYREFMQFDADIFGVDEIGADIEMILLTCEIYKSLGFKDFQVLISDRALVKDIPYSVLAVIDKLDKIGKEGVIAELKTKGYEKAQELMEGVLNLAPNERIQQILDAAAKAGCGEYVVFDPSIMRSFSYSTGTIWEVHVPEHKSSLLGGERFDSLVSRFTKVSVAGVGFGIGFDRTLEALEYRGLLPQNNTNTQLLMSVFDEQYLDTYIKYTMLAREEGIRTELYPRYSDKIGKQFKYADKKGIPYVFIVGEDEIRDHTVSVKDMSDGQQTTLALQDAFRLVKENA